MRRKIFLLCMMFSALMFGCTKDFSLVIKAENGAVEVAINGAWITSPLPEEQCQKRLELVARGEAISDLSKIRAGTVLTLKAVAKDGYEFSSWAGDLTGTKNPINFAMDSDKSVEAKFVKKIDPQPVLRSIVFDANGGTGTMVNPKIAQGESANLTASTFTRENYVFIGWSTTATGTVEYLDNASYTMGSADLTLYAVWVAEWTTYYENLKMRYIPAGGITFPSRTDNVKTTTILKNYYLGETEVVYKLWEVVYNWAVSNGYKFSDAGRMGSAEDGVEMTELHPVTMVTWRTAIVFCNAITEWFNATQNPSTQLQCAYYKDENYSTPIRESTFEAETSKIKGSQDCPYIKAVTSGNIDIANCTATGFRLPTYSEWECAARWQGKSELNSNYVTPLPTGCTEGYFWTKGNSASGATANSSDATETGKVAVYRANSSKTAPVRSKQPNGLGLCDMSGNVWEWNWETPIGYTVFYRVMSGGSWPENSDRLEIGNYYNGYPYIAEANYGFRLARGL